MAWPEISIDDFPPQRDDEPSSLRQDIIDELSDHFACALNRELLMNPDEQIAKQRVLNQFGDPIKIARQLWLDAMKEKIMSQRIMTGISAVMAVCCIAVVGIAWSMMQESRAFNLQLLEQFKLAQEKSASETTGELQPILFQLVQEGSEEQPAIGFEGTLSKGDGNNPVFTVEAVSDKNGLLDFGKLPWGKYVLTLKSPWGEAPQAELITTIPGRKFEETIVCPASVPEKVAVQFQVNWQNTPEEKNYLLCDFRHRVSISSNVSEQFFLSSYQEIQGRRWVYSHDLHQKSEGNVYLIDVENQRAVTCPIAADGSIKKIDVHQLDWHPTVEILRGVYYPPTIYLIAQHDLSKITEINSFSSTKGVRFDRGKLEIISFALPGQGAFISPFKKLSIDPALVIDKTPTALKQIHGFIPDRSTHETYAATEDQPNIWKINIPDLFPITQESGSLSNAL
ncbi:prealbumin-like fold domain-containing protein [Gimesia maris]|uniref:prealbumin-like fold domain-containing protein n=1 Tax=Gimesia maris TaxID=122 RepID=UPI0032F09262